jgi:quercetin dioxygenase-like cupin family protein
MPEKPIHAHETDFAWESEAADANATDALRWRTFVSAKRTATSGISMGVFEVPPGAELQPHTHHPQEVYFVTHGEAEVFRDGAWHPLRRGDVVYIPGDHVHGVRNRGHERIVIVWMFPADSYDEIEYFDA